MIFGRFFCGFACAFGSFGDAVNAIYRAVCKKLKKKPVQIPEHVASKLAYLKYVLLIIIVLMCYNGVYSKAQGTSPWDVFSMLHAGTSAGRLRNWSCYIDFVDCGNVSGRTFLLQKLMSDGSSIFTGSGITVILTSQRPGKLHSKVQWLYKKMSIRHRTSGGRIMEGRGRLLSVPEMYRHMSEEKYPLRSKGTSWK